MKPKSKILFITQNSTEPKSEKGGILFNPALYRSTSILAYPFKNEILFDPDEECYKR